MESVKPMTDDEKRKARAEKFGIPYVEDKTFDPTSKFVTQKILQSLTYFITGLSPSHI